MKECYLYKKLKNNDVQCLNCAHYCIVKEGKRGICGTRKNIQGTLYALNYQKPCAINIDPIEKKPFFHFLPGTYSLSIATVGCNFRCFNCQNYDISQGFKNLEDIPHQEILPKEIIQIALKEKLPSISYTYTEPAVFSEYALDIMKLAKKQKIKNCWVSNGFWSKELFDEISPYIDAANIDLKSFDENFYVQYCGGRLEPVLNTLKKIKQKGIWLEVTTLLIPTLNDGDENLKRIANFIRDSLGSETPWHITQFCAAISWKLQDLIDTPVEKLENAYKIGKKVGLKYVYTGNVPGLAREDTFCPNCKTVCIDRINYIVHRYDKRGKCPKCNTDLNIIE